MFAKKFENGNPKEPQKKGMPALEARVLAPPDLHRLLGVARETRRRALVRVPLPTAEVRRSPMGRRRGAAFHPLGGKLEPTPG